MTTGRNQNKEEQTTEKKKYYQISILGAIILLHATSKDNSEILGEVIDKAREMGYEFKTLDEFER